MAIGSPRVAVVGAGISGVASAAHLRASGIDVTVFERSSQAGGVWIYDERIPYEVSYPATHASKGDALPGGKLDEVAFAPPSPCYIGLTNNVGTRLMRTTLSAWPDGTPDYVRHHVLKDYIQGISKISGIENSTIYGARVTSVEKEDSKWRLEYAQLGEDGYARHAPPQYFDAVVVASGHYHAPRVPDIPGLKECRDAWPLRVWHSKSYRNPELLRDKTVLLIGGGTSSTDIAKEIGPVARKIYQSTRNGLFDFPATGLPETAIRIGEIVAFSINKRDSGVAGQASEGYLPVTAELKSGQKLCNIDYIIVATGYHMSLPFLKQFHNDDVPAKQASKEILVTDGTQIHNLHKDVFYIPDPSLIFVGVPYFSATFTLFEFQAKAVAAVLSGKASLPPEKAMREEYDKRVEAKGYGKPFHSVRGVEEEYVKDLLDWVNGELSSRGLPPVDGHTAEWHAAKVDQIAKFQELFGTALRGGNVEPAPEPVLLAAC